MPGSTGRRRSTTCSGRRDRRGGRGCDLRARREGTDGVVPDTRAAGGRAGRDRAAGRAAGGAAARCGRQRPPSTHARSPAKTADPSNTSTGSAPPSSTLIRRATQTIRPIPRTEHRQVHLRDHIQQTPRQMPFREPLPQRRRHQERLIPINSNEVLGHARNRVQPPGQTFMKQPPRPAGQCGRVGQRGSHSGASVPRWPRVAGRSSIVVLGLRPANAESAFHAGDRFCLRDSSRPRERNGDDQLVRVRPTRRLVRLALFITSM